MQPAKDQQSNRHLQLQKKARLGIPQSACSGKPLFIKRRDGSSSQMKTLDHTTDYNLDGQEERKEQRASSCLKKARSKRLQHHRSQPQFFKERMAGPSIENTIMHSEETNDATPYQDQAHRNRHNDVGIQIIRPVRNRISNTNAQHSQHQSFRYDKEARNHIQSTLQESLRYIAREEIGQLQNAVKNQLRRPMTCESRLKKTQSKPRARSNIGRGLRTDSGNNFLSINRGHIVLTRNMTPLKSQPMTNPESLKAYEVERFQKPLFSVLQYQKLRKHSTPSWTLSNRETDVRASNYSQINRLKDTQEIGSRQILKIEHDSSKVAEQNWLSSYQNDSGNEAKDKSKSQKQQKTPNMGKIIKNIQTRTGQTNEKVQVAMQQIDRILQAKSRHGSGQVAKAESLAVSAALKKTSVDILAENYRVTRLIVNDQDSFIRLHHGSQTVIDLIENIPVFCVIHFVGQAKSSDHRLGLPLNIIFINNDEGTANFQVYISMNTRAPDVHDHEKYVQIKKLARDRPQKVYFNQDYNGEKYSSNTKPKYPGQIYMRILSMSTSQIAIQTSFTKTHQVQKPVAQATQSRPASQLTHWLNMKEQHEAESSSTYHAGIEEELHNYYGLNDKRGLSPDFIHKNKQLIADEKDLQDFQYHAAINSKRTTKGRSGRIEPTTVQMTSKARVTFSNPRDEPCDAPPYACTGTLGSWLKAEQVETLMADEGRSHLAYTRRLQQQKCKRAESAGHLVRWDRYRSQKIQAVVNYLRMMKKQKRIKAWLSLSRLLVVTSAISLIIKRHQQHVQDGFTKLMLGVKIKVKFLDRLGRQFGGDVYSREQNRSRFTLTWICPIMQTTMNDKASESMESFLSHRLDLERMYIKVVGGGGAVQHLIDLLDEVLRQSRNRFTVLQEQTETEYGNMIRIYNLMLKVKTKKKSNKYYQKTRSLQTLEALSIGDPRVTEYMQHYSEKLKTDYLLDYMIRTFARTQEDLLALKSTLASHALGVDCHLLDELVVQKQKRLHSYQLKIKHLHVKQSQLEELLFSGTEVIDADKTYEFVLEPADQANQATIDKLNDSCKKLAKKGTKDQRSKKDGSKKSIQTPMPQKSGVESLCEDRAIAKRENLTQIINDIFKGASLHKHRAVISTLKTKFLFIPRRIHLHRILWKLATTTPPVNDDLELE